MQHTTWLFFKDMPLNFFDLPIFADIKTFLHSTFYIKLLILSHLFYGTHPHKRTIALFNTSFIIVTLIIPFIKKVEKWWSSNGCFNADSKIITTIMKVLVCEYLYVTWKLNKKCRRLTARLCVCQQSFFYLSWIQPTMFYSRCMIVLTRYKSLR